MPRYLSGFLPSWVYVDTVEELDILGPEQYGWKTDSKEYFQPLWVTSQFSVTVKNFIEACSFKTGKLQKL